jgi:hypothetical protein
MLRWDEIIWMIRGKKFWFEIQGEIGVKVKTMVEGLEESERPIKEGSIRKSV